MKRSFLKSRSIILVMILIFTLILGMSSMLLAENNEEKTVVIDVDGDINLDIEDPTSGNESEVVEWSIDLNGLNEDEVEIEISSIGNLEDGAMDLTEVEDVEEFFEYHIWEDGASSSGTIDLRDSSNADVKINPGEKEVSLDAFKGEIALIYTGEDNWQELHAGKYKDTIEITVSPINN